MADNQDSGAQNPERTTQIPGVLLPATAGDHLLLRQLGQFGTLSASSTLVALVGDLFGMDAPKIAAIGLIVLIAIYAIIYRDVVNRHVRPYWAVLALCGFFLTIVVGWHFRGEDENAGISKATGIIKYTARANDFLPELKTYIDGAQEEIWFTGVSFYLTLPQHRDALLSALERGVNVRILIYNPLSPNLGEIAKGFSQTPEQVASESDVTITNLKTMQEEWARNPKSANARFEVRLFSSVPRARMYIFDRRSEQGHTYFIPHVDDRNTPNLPGFLIRNVKTGIGPPYFEGIERVWQRSTPFEEFLPVYERARGRGSPAASAASDGQPPKS